MLEERLILSISYAVIAALLLVFCFYTNFTKKVKLISIFAVSLFYISSWKGYVGVLGWPTSEDLPDDFNILWVVIQEPNKSKSNEGELFIWIKEIDEFKKPIGDPRAFNLQWNKENHRIAQEALHKLQEGESKYNQNCAVCHGFVVKSAGGIPDLRKMTAGTHDAFNQIVLEGLLASNGMASFSDVLSEQAVSYTHLTLPTKA